jgi:DNA modification methylase
MGTLTRNLIPISSIFIPPGADGRIREPKVISDLVMRKSRSLMRFGQMQPILVEHLEPAVEGKEWRLLDGHIRLLSMYALTVRHGMGEPEVVGAFKTWNMVPGQIEVTTRDAMDPVMNLMIEFHANEDRDNFTWDEKGRYIRRIHDMLMTEHGRSDWNAGKTAEYINQSEATISHYLSLTDVTNPAAQSPRVKAATTKGAALKQLKIETVKQQNITRVKLMEEKIEKVPQIIVDSNLAARLSIYKGDCRDWIKRIPDNSLDWFHWDPPWGGEEGHGGAFAAHDSVQTEHDYALGLMTKMFSEIWRVLVDGGWIAIWYTPVHYSWLRLALQGHRFNPSTSCCLFCGKHIIKDHVWFSTNYSCIKSPYRFWVNPYPNMWRKSDRKADGHEIQRFLTKETEPFLLAGKQGARTPILMRSDRGNVFDFNSVPSEARRHVNHKPWAMLSEILTLISVPGSLGADASAGSGSIIEAAYNTKRKIVVAEMDPDHHATCLNIGAEILKQKAYSPKHIATWLESNMTP